MQMRQLRRPSERRRPCSRGLWFVGPASGRPLLTMAVGVVVGCGGSAEAGKSAERAPSHAGEVWTIAREDDRAAVPAALTAYLNGMQTMVLDGSDAYAGMTKLHGDKSDGDGKLFTLANGVTATITPAGDSLQLRFSSGEVIPMYKAQTGRTRR